MKNQLLKLKKRYRGEWLAVAAGAKAPVESTAKLLAHHPDRKTLYQLLREKKVKDAYITFAPF